MRQKTYDLRVKDSLFNPDERSIKGLDIAYYKKQNKEDKTPQIFAIFIKQCKTELTKVIASVGQPVDALTHGYHKPDMQK